MNKLTLFSLSVFFIIHSIRPMENPASLGPKEIFTCLRFLSAADFKKAINLIDADQLQKMRIEHNFNIFHVLAWPFQNEEIKHKSEIDNCLYSPRQMARIQAIKADMLLKKIGIALLKQKTTQGNTPGMIAAKAGNLRVLARFILTKSPDELDAIAHLNTNCIKRLYADCLDSMRVMHLYPPLRSDLHVDLTTSQLADVYEACDSAQSQELSANQAQYIFEAFLTHDVYKELEENRKDSRVMEFYDSLMAKPVAPSK